VKYLVVSNQRLDDPALLSVMRAHAQELADFHVVVPATAPQDQSTPPNGDADQVAQDRLARALDRFHAAGLKATGEVGHADPLDAIDTALKRTRYAGIVITTLPLGISRWLHLDLPHRAARKARIPVECIVAPHDPNGRSEINSVGVNNIEGTFE